MNWTRAGKYAAHSDCGRFVIDWGDVVPPYFAHLRGPTSQAYGGSLGAHPDRESAKRACATYGDNAKRGRKA